MTVPTDPRDDARALLDEAALRARELQSLLARPRPPIDALYRAAHTLKALASTAGHHAVASRAHAFEDALDDAHRGRGHLDDVASAELRAHADALLHALAGGVAPPIADDERRLLDASAARRLDLACAAGRGLWRLSSIAHLDALDVETAALREDASRVGECIVLAPGALTDDGGGLHVSLLFASAEPEATLRAMLARDGRSLAEVRAPTVSSDARSDDETVRVRVRDLDALAAHREALMRAWAAVEVRAVTTGDAALRESLRALRASVEGVGVDVEALRQQPFARVVGRVHLAVRAASEHAKRPVRLVVRGADTPVDLAVADALAALLVHLVRNAVEHGIEPADVRATRRKPPEGTLTLRVSRGPGALRVELDDDGAGIDPQAVLARAVAVGALTGDEAVRCDAAGARALLLRAGFSTASDTTEARGRGVGLDAVRAAVDAMGGTVSLDSEPGRFTRVSIVVPR